jgi:hypothetical protein
MSTLKHDERTAFSSLERNGLIQPPAGGVVDGLEAILRAEFGDYLRSAYEDATLDSWQQSLSHVRLILVMLHPVRKDDHW